MGEGRGEKKQVHVVGMFSQHTGRPPMGGEGMGRAGRLGRVSEAHTPGSLASPSESKLRHPAPRFLLCAPPSLLTAAAGARRTDMMSVYVTSETVPMVHLEGFLS